MKKRMEAICGKRKSRHVCRLLFIVKEPQDVASVRRLKSVEQRRRRRRKRRRRMTGGGGGGREKGLGLQIQVANL
jgi:hypothetical protein